MVATHKRLPWICYRLAYNHMWCKRSQLAYPDHWVCVGIG